MLVFPKIHQKKFTFILPFGKAFSSIHAQVLASQTSEDYCVRHVHQAIFYLLAQLVCCWLVEWMLVILSEQIIITNSKQVHILFLYLSRHAEIILWKEFKKNNIFDLTFKDTLSGGSGRKWPSSRISGNDCGVEFKFLIFVTNRFQQYT